jgi:hypothetical protein
LRSMVNAPGILPDLPVKPARRYDPLAGVPI